MKESLATIIDQLKLGDKKALDTLFYLYNKRIYHFGLSYFHNKEESEEIVQEVFLKLWFNRKSINRDGAFESYIFTIAKNTILNSLKKKIHHKAYQEYRLHVADITSNSTEDDVIYHDFEKLYEIALQVLPKKRKEIFILSRMEGLSYQQIAEKLGISVKTVETQMQLALKHFRGVLKSNTDLIVSASIFFLAAS
ncbi:MAG: RNA polymerase sigma-70 factor [Imperialibacter sp.]|uniref:RNA polymerase sigma-70 factor n=1 Tax=Imperialibacter sp. TaxID=2038411 RepID=UPI0032EE1BBA